MNLKIMVNDMMPPDTILISSNLHKHFEAAINGTPLEDEAFLMKLISLMKEVDRYTHDSGGE